MRRTVARFPEILSLYTTTDRPVGLPAVFANGRLHVRYYDDTSRSLARTRTRTSFRGRAFGGAPDEISAIVPGIS